MAHLSLYCHSRVGGNRDYTVRANASQIQNVAMLFGKCYQAIFAEYCAIVNNSNFRDPIPACAGMTRTVYLFLFYEHCSGLCYLLFFKSSYRRRRVTIAPQGLIIPLPRPLRGHPFASEGELYFITLSLNHFITCPLSLLSVQNRCIIVNSMAVFLNSRCHMLESRRV